MKKFQNGNWIPVSGPIEMNCAVLHASPTCGKTTMTKVVRDKILIDTDLIWFTPQTSRNQFNVLRPMKEYWDEEAAKIFNQSVLLAKLTGGVVLTNLHPFEHWGYRSVAGGRIISFRVANDEFKKRLLKRTLDEEGGDEQKAKVKFEKNWESWGKNVNGEYVSPAFYRACKDIYLLEEGEYLTEALGYNPSDAQEGNIKRNLQILSEAVKEKVPLYDSEMGFFLGAKFNGIIPGVKPEGLSYETEEEKKWQFKKAYKSEDGLTSRLVFMRKNPVADYDFVVYKSWSDADRYTVKVWKGDYNRTVEHWKTKVPFDPEDKVINKASRRIASVLK